MRTASAFFASTDINRRPWLILGKGPSFRKFRNIDANAFNVLALNHVARDVRCDIALMMDFDVWEHAGEHIAANAGFVAMPWHPHRQNRPSETTLADLAAADPRLAALAAQNRLITFNAETGRLLSRVGDEPITEIKFFSAEAALNLLADNGARVIRTLGIDGGTQYSDDFRDLNDKTLLANGQVSFDRQFERFSRTLRRHRGLTFGPLNVQTPVRIFIGADPTQVMGARLFEYSVQQTASISVECTIINNDGLPVPSDPKKRARTGFSFCRFKIPELCGYRGRGIYVDADMQVFTDIKDLWTRPFDDAWLLYSELREQQGGKRIPQYSVMLLDCEKLRWNAVDLVKSLEADGMDYAKLMFEFSMMPADKKKPLLEFEWNSLEHYEDGRTKLIHYTDMPTQPWVSNRNKNGEVWYKLLRQAVSENYVSVEEIHAEIARGHVSPELPQWAGLAPYPDASRLARDWVAPYRRLVGA